MINIHQDVDDLLKELNGIGPSIIFGGYLRDLYLGHKPNDVDIATNISIDVIENMFKNLEKAARRTTDSGHEVYSFKMHRTEKIFVEIICEDGDLMNKSKLADYTINSLIYDGKQIIDSQGCFNDMMNTTIREVDINIIKEDLVSRPYLWLKTIRLMSLLNFGLSPKVSKILEDNMHVINNISTEIIQNEGHKVLNGKGVIRVMFILSRFGLISKFDTPSYYADKLAVSLQPHQKLVLLSKLTNEQVVEDFIKFFKFSQIIVDKFKELNEAFNSTEKPANRLKHQIITIKKILEG